MSGVIDTNILLYAANQDAPEHPLAREFVLRAGNSPGQWYLTEGIVYEFLRVATHPKVLPRPLVWREALGFLEPILTSPRFAVLSAGDRHWSVLEDLLLQLDRPAGNLFFDIRTVALMQEHGIREIYSADADFLQFRNIQVVNPLRPGEG